MNKTCSQELKDELDRFLRCLGAYKTRIASAHTGFDKAIEGCRPRDIMKNCNSVIVFGIYVGDDYYRSIEIEEKTMGDNRIMHIFRDWLQYRAANHLREVGCQTMVPTGMSNRSEMMASLSYKLAAYEAGFGVYGKCGIIITPEYGPKVNLGVVLTDAVLKPDSRLADFDPCQGCRVCVEFCPPGAVRDTFDSPEGFSRDICVKFVKRLREETGDRHFLCGYCYDSCPFGKSTAPGLKLSRYRTLTSLEPREREQLLIQT